MPRVFVDIEGEARQVGITPTALTSLINRGIREGWSQRQTISVARNAGLSFANATFRAMWHAAADVLSRAPATRAIPPGVGVDITDVASAGFGRPGQFYYWIETTYVHLDTGDTETQMILMQRDSLVDPSEVEQDALDAIGDEPGNYDLEDGMAIAGANVWAVTER
jgi:hypothetical protein